jgi:hypothetical protein
MRQLKKFVYSRSTYTSKHYSLQVIKFVESLLTYTQSVQKIDSKRNLLQVMEFVFYRFTCSWTVQKMGSKHDLPQLKKVVIGARHKSCMWCKRPRNMILSNNKNNEITLYRDDVCWTFAPNMTCYNSRNKNICAQPTVCLCWKWTRNMTRAK